MHEQSIVESLLALAIENAGKVKASKILRIYLVVGDLSGVLEEAVEFYFSFLSRGTIAEGASLFFMRAPAEVRCRNCGTVYSPENLKLQCPKCKETQIEILAGQELYVDNMEVE